MATSERVNVEELDRYSMEDIFLTKVSIEDMSALLARTFARMFPSAIQGEAPRELAQNEQAKIRAWKLSGLVPLMLMHRPSGTGVVGRSELCLRADEFARDTGATS